MLAQIVQESWAEPDAVVELENLGWKICGHCTECIICRFKLTGKLENLLFTYLYLRGWKLFDSHYHHLVAK